MDFKTRILAGTALGLLMAAPAYSQPIGWDFGRSRTGMIVMAQAEGEQPPVDSAPSADTPAVEVPGPAVEAPAAEAPVQAEEAPAPRKRKQAAEEPAAPAAEAPAAEAPAPAEEAPAPRKRKQAAEEPAAPAAEAPAEEAPAPRKRKQAAEEPAAPAAEAPAEEAPTPRKRKQAAEEPAAPSADTPAIQPQPAEAEQPAKKPARKPKKPVEAEAPAAPAEAPVPPAAEAPAAEPAKPVDAAKPVDDSKPSEAAKPAEAAPANEAEAPARPRRQKREKQPAPNDGGQAPVFDSQKQAPPEAQPVAPATAGEKSGPASRRRPRANAPAEQAVPAAPPVPPPASDQAAQQAAQPVEVKPVTAEKGKRRNGPPPTEDGAKRERPEGTEVLKTFGDRVVIQFGDQVTVESNDRPRLSRGAKDVYYEDLPQGRSRETIERPDGTRVVTVRNRYGDVIRRSKILPDGDEVVLVYVDDRNFQRVRDRRDPGDDLPPMRLNVPKDQYILESTSARGEEQYYDFLDKPPVERVERLYSVDEVKRSARIRDKTPRVDLDTLNFDFGSATVPEDQVEKLDGVANAMEKLLKKNPAETFLIEGHTDAVGSDLANLALSDRRAESIADALTNVFDIPPENLTTQGYGEEFLKVRVQGPERENRRVTIRRITPLVAPVASAK